MIFRRATVLTLTLLVVLASAVEVAVAQQELTPFSRCQLAVHGKRNSGSFGAIATKDCRESDGGATPPSNGSGQPAKQILVPCLTSVNGQGVPLCALQAAICIVESRQNPTQPALSPFIVLTRDANGVPQLTGPACVAPSVAQPPTVTPFDAYQEVMKLVPAAPIGAAPGRGSTLVNIQTIFWVNTSADRSLGPVTLLGHRVGLRIHAQSVDWNFGDGSEDENGALGRPYMATDSCTTAQCSGFYGHEFRKTGSFTVSAAVTWSGQFSVDGGAWQDIANPATGANTVTGPSTTSPLRVFQARDELVSDPAGD
jgi:hypothetical protein